MICIDIVDLNFHWDPRLECFEKERLRGISGKLSIRVKSNF